MCEKKLQQKQKYCAPGWKHLLATILSAHTTAIAEATVVKVPEATVVKVAKATVTEVATEVATIAVTKPTLPLAIA